MDDRWGQGWEWRYGAPAEGGSHEGTALSPLGVATTYAIVRRSARRFRNNVCSGALPAPFTWPARMAPSSAGLGWSPRPSAPEQAFEEHRNEKSR
jgi:hypothetical protein